ncbi:hypothetical protein EDB92DRAFT_1948398 [Lactarius akahatsu]|uniref:Uncharacterized protein n=1 Tax=Lactarius akahatsu TaxID=416441 RepID=A0AAD4Q923_9AGAM|nr:hypothetical protein EDB92DRAFT_1948398 [Lactarius akahatsu]
MASIFSFLLYFSRKLRFTKGTIHHCIKRWALFLAFLGRRLGVNHLWHGGKRGASHKPAPPERSFSRTEARLQLGDGVVAASRIPTSAGQPDLHDVSGQQPSPSRASPPASLTVEPPIHRDHTNPTIVVSTGIHPNRSSANLSIRSRASASDRLSIIQTHSRESLHAPVGHQTARSFPRAPHRQFGRGPSPSPSPSRERPSRSPSPTDRIPRVPRLEIDTTNLHPPTHVEDRKSPINTPSVTSPAHAPLSPPSLHGNPNRRQSSTSVIVGVENPSTDSLPLSPSTNRPPLTDEPYTIGSPIDQSSPITDAPDTREGSTNSPTASSPSASSNLELPAGRFLQLINSEQVPRYTKEVTVQVEYIITTIKPLSPLAGPAKEHTLKFHLWQGRSFKQMSHEQGSLKEDCAPWVPATHPDGALYFFDQDRRLFTDTDMHDPILRDEMDDFYHYLQRILGQEEVVIPSQNYDLTLDIMPSEDGRIQWSYYYACHETRCLFWLDTYDATHMISELFGVTSPAHVRHRLEALYWTHWSLFPAVFDGRRLVQAVYDELVGILSHGCMDVMTSKSSTLPYDAETMQQMIRLVRNAKGSDTGLVYHTAAIMLFLAPEVHLRDLERLWTDEVIIETVWKSFMTKLLEEWGELILWSTVMLTANVGFLAIPGVIISNINNPLTSASELKIFTSAAQIASCMSVEASAGSIVIGMLLVRHNRTKQKEDPAGASTYLYQNTHRIFGLEPMAIIFSLPWALLMWAMVMFSIALLLLCFSISNVSTRISVAVTSVIVAALIVWCIRSAWESSEEKGVWLDRFLPYIKHVLDRVYGVRSDLVAQILRREGPSSLPYGHSRVSLPRIPDHERVDVQVVSV